MTAAYDHPPLILMVDDNRADVELTREALLELPGAAGVRQRARRRGRAGILARVR